MKKIFVSIFVSLVFLSTFAQQDVRCNTMHADSVLRAKHSLESLVDFENWLQAKMALYKASHQNGSRAVITIPIIFHVIHNGDAVGVSENISQAQVNSQIASLNEDFRKAAGTLGFNTHPAGADCEIEFCPAVVDPNGNILPEPGIDRQNRGQSSWEDTDIDDILKPATIWDPDRYCNVWTVNFGGTSANLLGYAQFPNSSGLQGISGNGAANTDGVVVRYNACGRVGTLTATYNKGRTLTHELGHWLGLRHIWGDQNCGNDYCNDTPTSSGANYNCPTGQNTCPDPGNDMVENYMDYSGDACMNIFTQNQKDRMVVVMANSPRRLSLLSSNVCSIPFTFAYTGRVIDAVTSLPVANAKVYMDGPADYNLVTDASGNFIIPNLQQDNYTVYAGKWGYVTNYLSSQSFTPSTPLITIALQPGYYDDFLFDFAWTPASTATSGAWVRAVPTGTTYTAGGITYQSNPGSDVPGDFLDKCYVTGNAGGSAGNDDVDGGTVTLTSPVMDLSSYAEPVVRYYRWFYNGGGSGTPNDSLVVSLVNGTQVIDIDKVGQGSSSNQWTYKSYRVKNYIPSPGNNIYFRVRTFDQTSTGHLVEGGLDLFRVMDSTGTSSQPPVANFSSSTVSVCAGRQVVFNDLSSNTPTSWSWTFQGGSPNSANNANPSVTYNLPGTYMVTLTVGNSAGSNTITRTAFITVNPVVARFSQDKTGICPGQSVIYTSESSCTPSTLKWIFTGGDVSTSTDDTVTVSYSSPGFYDVTLIAGNSFGNDTIIQNLAVQVYPPASLNTISVPDTNNTGLGSATVNVNGGVPPYSYLWYDPLAQTTATATALAAGVYNVRVTDGHGCSSITSVTVGNVLISNLFEIKNAVFEIYPNPVNSENWNLKAGEELAGKEIVVNDNLGRTVLRRIITERVSIIPSAHLAPGVYFLKVSSVSGVAKLVKQ